MEEVPLQDMVESPPVAAALPIAPNADHYKCVIGNAIRKAAACVSNCNWDSLDSDGSTPAGGINVDAEGVVPPGEVQGMRLAGRLRGSLEYWRRKLFEGITPYESYVCTEEQSDITVFSSDARLLGYRYNVYGLYQLYEIPSEQSFRIVFASDAVVAALHRQPEAHGIPLLEGMITLWFTATANDEACDMWLVAWPRLTLTPLAALWHFGIYGSQTKALGDTLRSALLKRQPVNRT
jgi:hypothetical protein